MLSRIWVNDKVKFTETVMVKQTKAPVEATVIGVSAHGNTYRLRMPDGSERLADASEVTA